MLLALPLLLALQKLVELEAFGERSHQLFAESKATIQGLTQGAYLVLDLLPI